MAYQVTAPLVQVLTSNGAYVQVSEDGFLPDDIDDASLEQLIAMDMVVEAEPPADGEDAPKSRSRAKK